MARLKPYHPEQGRLLPVIFDQQIQPGTFEFAVHHLVDEMDLSALLARYRNDETGARAYDPRALLKVVLVAYSRGLLSSRGIGALVGRMWSSRRSRPTRGRTSRRLRSS